jgi:hypothetical protein
MTVGAILCLDLPQSNLLRWLLPPEDNFVASCRIFMKRNGDINSGGTMKSATKLGWALPVLALLLAALACHWSDVAPPAAPVIEPSPLPTFAIPTLTLVPTETPLPTPTSTPDVPIAWPKTEGINCRYGPGQEWEVVSTILPDTVFEIKGRTIDTAWWYVRDPTQVSESYCWVSYDVVNTAGNLNVVRIVEPPEASVTGVKVDTAVVTFNGCGSSNQVNLNGSITSNGPGTVTYHWELGGVAQYTTEDKTLNFDRSGTNNVGANMEVTDCGGYTAILRVTAPEEIFAEKDLTIQAP